MTLAVPRLSPWTKATAAIVVLLVVGLAILAMVRFGSLSTALGYVAGDRLLVDSPSKSFGSVDAGSVQSIPFLVMNRAGRPVTILGSRSSRGCTLAADLPMTIPAGATRVVRVVVTTRGLAGEFTANVRLFSDDPSRGTLALAVHGSIRNPATAAVAHAEGKS